MRFSANLGFLFTDRPITAAIGAARRAGFDGVELHWPFETPPETIRAALGDMPLLGLNTSRGDASKGEFGLSALSGREAEARRAIEEAVAYAARAGAGHVHVMAGIASGPQARSTFVANLAYAAGRAGAEGLGLVIEPLNPFDAPGYFLNDVALARSIIEEVDHPALRLMLDCYHVTRMGGDPLRTARDHLDILGHVQFAAVPDRGEPDHGEVDYARLLPEIAALGYSGHFGAEYRPLTGNLAWLDAFRGAA